MPTAAAKFCSAPRCQEIVTEGRCERHRIYSPIAARERGSAARRGYDGKWQSFRSMFLARHPLCYDCEQAGRTTLANEVHHRVKVRADRSLRLTEANCLPLCRSCHSARTGRGE